MTGWDPRELFEMFLIHHEHAHGGRAPTRDEGDRFAIQTQHLVEMNFRNRGWSMKLERSGGAADAASEIVAFCVLRAGRFQCRKPWRSIPRDEAYLPLIKSLNRAIKNRVMDWLNRRQPAGSNHCTIEGIGAAVEDTGRFGTADIDRVLRHEASVDFVLRKFPGDMDLGIALYHVQRNALMRFRTFDEPARLPEKIRQRCTYEQHAHIIARLRSLVLRIIARAAEEEEAIREAKSNAGDEADGDLDWGKSLAFFQACCDQVAQASSAAKRLVGADGERTGGPGTPAAPDDRAGAGAEGGLELYRALCLHGAADS